MVMAPQNPMMAGKDDDDVGPAHKKDLRIYVGGMDPIRGLTAQDVLHRLESRLKRHDGSSVQMQDLYVGDCYFQFTVGNINDDDDPLATIKSWFHNVTWKGCKLRVEEARPHFLQRLQNEILSRNLNRQQVAEFVAKEKAQTTTSDEQSNNKNTGPFISATSGAAAAAAATLPRHWRIRRGFGQTAHHVDTQPCRVTDWAVFSRTRERYRVQQKKLAQSSEVDPKKLSYYNRSIHLIFSDSLNEDDDDVVVRRQLNGETRDMSSGDDSSDQSTTTTEVNEKLKNGSKYIWSDDDDGDGRDSSSADMSSHTDPAAIPMPQNMALDATESLSEDNSDDENLQNSRLHVDSISSEEELAGPSCDFQQKSEFLETNAGREYIWSDDGESSNEESAGSAKQRKSKTLRVLEQNDDGLNEFAPGVVDFDDDSSNERASSADEPTTSNTDDVDLQRDVEKNLQVLSQLFPELSKQEPLQTKDNVAEKSEKEVKNPTKLSGWGAMGQMLRFDPTNPQSSNQFLLDEDNKNARAKADNQSSESDSSSMVSEGAEDIAIKEDPTQNSNPDNSKKGNIYEQAKLEQVFKEVRQSDNLATRSVSEAGTPGFSFGFDLGDAKAAETTDASGPFSFAFSLPESFASATNEEKNQQDYGADLAKGADSLYGHLESQQRQRRAFEFPSEEELNERVRHFYCDFNEGSRIMNDLEGWRNDPSVKELWMKERFALTQDWKRKHKYAMSKKQKRFK